MRLSSGGVGPDHAHACVDVSHHPAALGFALDVAASDVTYGQAGTYQVGLRIGGHGVVSFTVIVDEAGNYEWQMAGQPVAAARVPVYEGEDARPYGPHHGALERLDLDRICAVCHGAGQLVAPEHLVSSRMTVHGPCTDCDGSGRPGRAGSAAEYPGREFRQVWFQQQMTEGDVPLKPTSTTDGR